MRELSQNVDVTMSERETINFNNLSYLPDLCNIIKINVICSYERMSAEEWQLKLPAWATGANLRIEDVQICGRTHFVELDSGKNTNNNTLFHSTMHIIDSNSGSADVQKDMLASAAKKFHLNY